MSVPVRIPEGFVDELKARLRPSDIIGKKVKLKKQGKEWVGLSPFTSEKTPSFYVNDQKKIYKCFSSGQGGDIISFVMETERLSFMEAVEKLADDAGLSLPKATPESQAEYNRRQRLFEVCEAAAKFFEASLRDAGGVAARQYLASRGLTTEAWSRHRLGHSPDSWDATFDHLSRLGFSRSEIIETGLAIEKSDSSKPYDRFRGRLMFPISDTRGAVIAFGGRALEPDAKPKYLNSNDTTLFHKSDILYRYRAARASFGESDATGLIVCEGYMDAIALAEAGFGHAVAPLGTALTPKQLELLWRAGPEPVLCFDGDAAGRRAAYNSLDKALPELTAGRSVFFCMLEDGRDPDDIIRDYGAAAMAERLAAPLSLVELLWQRERDAGPALDTPERKAGLNDRLMKAANEIKDNGVRAAYQRDLKTRMNDYFWSLRSSRSSAGRSDKSNTGGPSPLVAGASPAKTKGLGLIIRAIDCPHLLELGFEHFARADLPDPDVAFIRDAILTQVEAGLTVDRGSLTTHLETCGKPRAVDLLNTYPAIPEIAQGGQEEREWLIALEQHARPEDKRSSATSSVDAFSNPADARARHRSVSERRARMVRRNEAAEQADKN